jgi:lipoprotein-anchoring transpeptidase ErfK/SrfK
LQPAPPACLIRRVLVVAFLRISAMVVLLCLVPLASAAPAPQAAAEPGAPTAAISWTAQITRSVAVRKAPREGAKVAARVTTYTAFWRRAQQLMVLSTIQTDPATGRRWVLVRLPGRPNLAQGFVPLDAVKLRATRTRIVVRLGARKVELWRSGRRVARWSAAVGTGSTPTPTGLFAVQDPVPSADFQRSYLGPYIITLTAYSPVLTSFMGGNGLVAIHGTNATGLLGQAVSHGCIRITNDAVTRLYSTVAPGTPVEIVR